MRLKIGYPRVRVDCRADRKPDWVSERAVGRRSGAAARRVVVDIGSGATRSIIVAGDWSP